MKHVGICLIIVLYDIKCDHINVDQVIKKMYAIIPG